MVIREKGGDWMSTLTFTFTESNRKVITKNWIRCRSSREGSRLRGVNAEHRPE